MAWSNETKANSMLGNWGVYEIRYRQGLPVYLVSRGIITHHSHEKDRQMGQIFLFGSITHQHDMTYHSGRNSGCA